MLAILENRHDLKYGKATFIELRCELLNYPCQDEYLTGHFDKVDVTTVQRKKPMLARESQWIRVLGR